MATQDLRWEVREELVWPGLLLPSGILVVAAALGKVPRSVARWSTVPLWLYAGARIVVLCALSAFVPLCALSAFVPLCALSAFFPLYALSAFVPLCALSAFFPLCALSAFIPLCAWNTFIPLGVGVLIPHCAFCALVPLTHTLVNERAVGRRRCGM